MLINNHEPLICPRCGGETMHSLTVTVFDRGEDAKLVTRTEVLGGFVASHLIPNEASANPSSRRHAVTIDFCCEACDDPESSGCTLILSQHKGQTEVIWEIPSQE